MKKGRWVGWLLVLFCLPAMVPLLRGDFFHFSDENHIANLYQMIRGFESGQLPPRWAPDMSYGYGYPFFNYFYPLPFYLGSLFFFITGSLVSALKGVFLVTIPVSGVFMYWWLSRHTNRWASFAGGLIYVYTPYRAVDLYVRGAVGEALAFVFFPLVALCVFDVVKKKGWWRVGWLGAAVGGMVLSHNLAPMMFLPWLLIYGLILAGERKEWRRWLRVGVGVVLGLGFSAYWWFPAFVERGLLVGETPFNYQDHFPFIKQLILPSWGYGASNPGLGDDISFQVGVVNLGLVVWGGLVLLRRLRRRNWSDLALLVWFLASMAAGGFLMNIRSSFLWEAFFLSGYVQFPWRILMLMTFLTAGMVIFWPKKGGGKVVLGALGLLSLLLTVGYFRPSEYFGGRDDYFLNRFFANRTLVGVRDKISKEYDLYSEDYLILPVVVEERPGSLPKAKFVSSDLVVESIEEINAVNFKAKVSGEGLLEINNYYFPGWEVKVDGERGVIEKLEPHGNMGVKVPEGEHEIEVRWTETNLRKGADGVSLFSLMVILGFLVRRRRDGKK